MTLFQTDDAYKNVQAHKEVIESKIARRAIENNARKNTLLNAMTEKSDRPKRIAWNSIPKYKQKSIPKNNSRGGTRLCGVSPCVYRNRRSSDCQAATNYFSWHL